MTADDASIVIDYIEALEERVRHEAVMSALIDQGYTAEEIDGALMALGTVAGRTCSVR